MEQQRAEAKESAFNVIKGAPRPDSQLAGKTERRAQDAELRNATLGSMEAPAGNAPNAVPPGVKEARKRVAQTINTSTSTRVYPATLMALNAIGIGDSWLSYNTENLHAPSFRLQVDGVGEDDKNFYGMGRNRSGRVYLNNHTTDYKYREENSELDPLCPYWWMVLYSMVRLTLSNRPLFSFFVFPVVFFFSVLPT